MLSAAFTEMDKDIWKRSPTTTNAVERKNRDCKSDACSLYKADDRNTIIKLIKWCV